MKTDINAIRDICKCLLNLPVDKEEAENRFFLSHPYFETAVFHCFKNKKIYSSLDLTKESEYLQAVKYWEGRIDLMDLPLLFSTIRKQYRLLLFKLSADYLSEKDYGEFLHYVWTVSENPNDDVNVPKSEAIKLFQKADKKYLMEENDYKHYSSLPDIITIYRGVSPGRVKNGLSWTENFEKAEWFSKRFGDGFILKGTAKKEDVLAYFNSRDEDEIVINPKRIKDIEKI